MAPPCEPTYSRPRERWRYATLLTRPDEYRLPERNPDCVRDILHFDMISEYDARILNAHLDSSLASISADFLTRKSEWLRDEDNHFQGFSLIYASLGGTPEAMAAVYERKGDFSHIEHLLQDEFSAALVLAYDEIVTTRGYIDDLPIYDGIGGEVGRFVRRVIADEAQHYSKFMNFLRLRYPARIDEAAARIRDIRRADGQRPYRATFVLDHIEDVFSTEMLDRCADILLRNLRRPIGDRIAVPDPVGP
jgi:hypothetical protein